MQFKEVYEIQFFLFLLILLFITSCRRNQPSEFYVINGEIKNYNGKIYLTQTVDTIYYSNKFRKDSAIAVNGKFEFRISKKNSIPFPFYLNIDNTRTSWFILEPKDQQIIIDSLYHGAKPIIICENSIIPREKLILEERNKPVFEEFKLELNKIRNANFPKDSIETHMIAIRKKMSNRAILILKDFTKEYPNSYVAFWKIVIIQMYNGFSEELESAYKNLSSSIKQTEAANIFYVKDAIFLN